MAYETHFEWLNEFILLSEWESLHLPYLSLCSCFVNIKKWYSTLYFGYICSEWVLASFEGSGMFLPESSIHVRLAHITQFEAQSWRIFDLDPIRSRSGVESGDFPRTKHKKSTLHMRHLYQVIRISKDTIKDQRGGNWTPTAAKTSEKAANEIPSLNVYHHQIRHHL